MCGYGRLTDYSVAKWTKFFVDYVSAVWTNFKRSEYIFAKNTFSQLYLELKRDQ